MMSEHQNWTKNKAKLELDIKDLQEELAGDQNQCVSLRHSHGLHMISLALFTKSRQYTVSLNFRL